MRKARRYLRIDSAAYLPGFFTQTYLSAVRTCFMLTMVLALPASLTAQSVASYAFMKLPAGARLQALGGVNVSLADRDANFFFTNPALVGDTLSSVASASYRFYVADIGQASVAYVHHSKKIGNISLGVQHMSYGEIMSYDDAGNEIGTFSSGESLVVVSKSHTVSNFRLGINIKGAFSNLAGHRSAALAIDAGGIFKHPEQDFTVGLAIQHAGFVLREYSPTSQSTLPFTVAVGTSFKPEHMPIRFSITAQPLNSKYTGTRSIEGNPLLNRVLRRFNFGTEVLLHKNVNLLVGYNYLARQELRLDNAGGGAGVSFGFSIAMKSFEFAFSRAGYVAGSAGYGFTLSAALNKMLIRS